MGDIQKQLNGIMHGLGATNEQASLLFHRWCAHFIRRGFTNIETLITANNPDGEFCLRSGVSIADVFLLPQVKNAVVRFGIEPAQEFPNITRVCRSLSMVPEVRARQPHMFPDAPDSFITGGIDGMFAFLY
jgi:glutathione S-transferase